jgi:hypothetical protein
MSSAELDLDAPPEDRPAGAGHAVALVMTLAIGLTALGGGALAGSAFAGADPPRLPPAATLAIRDLYVDTSSSGPTADPARISPADADSGARIGRPVIVLRLEVDNPGPAALLLSGLALDGVVPRAGTRSTSPGSTVLPLHTRVESHKSGVVDVSVSPGCDGGRPSPLVRARLLFTGSPGITEVPVPTSPELGQAGGLCALLDTELPRGWQAPLQAVKTRVQGRDLEVTLADLSADQVAGILVDNRLLPTVLVGDRVLSTSALLRPGRPTMLRLSGPPPCVEDSSTVTVPTTVRFLARDSTGLRQQMIIVGPELTRWLRRGCIP